MAFNQSMRSIGRNTVSEVTRLGRMGVLGRTLALLETFQPGEASLSLAELSRRSGLPKPTVHRMTAEMCRERMLERLQDGSYRLGLRLFEIGERVQTNRTLSEAALPIMEDLRQVTKQRIHLAVLDGVDVVYVGRPERASPAEGYPAAHAAEQGRIIREALATSGRRRSGPLPTVAAAGEAKG